MFHFCVSMLTLLAMLLHAALGCCWHHAHTRETECAAHHQAANGLIDAGDMIHSHCMFHGHSHQVEEPSEASHSSRPESQGHQHRPGDCDEGTCTYMAAEDLKVPTPWDGSLLSEWLPVSRIMLAGCPNGRIGNRFARDRSLTFVAGSSLRDVTQAWLL